MVGRALAGLALPAGLSTCGPGHGDDCLKSTGPMVTERRNVESGLVTVTTYDNVDLRLVQDSQTYAEVRAGKNLIGDIEFTRKGNSLELANTSRYSYHGQRPQKSRVTVMLSLLKHLYRTTNYLLLR